MFEALENGIGLDLVLSLQSGRNDIFDMLVMLLNAMGNPIFYIAFLPWVYWAINRHIGIRLYFSLIIIGLVVFTLKDLFGRPRPFQASDLVMPLFDANGFGIPSGHTAVSMVVWGYLAYSLRRTGFTIFVVFYVALQAWGRVYAGVHFPQDIVAGLLVGAITLVLYIRLADAMARVYTAQALWLQIITSFALGILGLFAYATSEDALSLVGLFIGGSLAASLTTEVNFYPHSHLPRRMAQYIVGFILSFGLLFGLDILFGENDPAAVLRIIRYALVAFFALLVWPLLSIRLNWMKTEQPQQDATT